MAGRATDGHPWGTPVWDAARLQAILASLLPLAHPSGAASSPSPTPIAHGLTLLAVGHPHTMCPEEDSLLCAVATAPRARSAPSAFASWAF